MHRRKTVNIERREHRRKSNLHASYPEVAGPLAGDREKRTDIYIYIYAVKLLSGPSLAISGVIIWAKQVLLSGPSCF